jgi:hypothetical protein
MKNSYASKDELMADVLEKYKTFDEITFIGIDQYNRALFNFSISLERADVSMLSAIVSEANFIDRYYQQLTHLVEKA